MTHVFWRLIVHVWVIFNTIDLVVAFKDLRRIIVFIAKTQMPYLVLLSERKHQELVVGEGKQVDWIRHACVPFRAASMLDGVLIENAHVSHQKQEQLIEIVPHLLCVRVLSLEFPVRGDCCLPMAPGLVQKDGVDLSAHFFHEPVTEKAFFSSGAGDNDLGLDILLRSIVRGVQSCGGEILLLALLPAPGHPLLAAETLFLCRMDGRGIRVQISPGGLLQHGGKELVGSRRQLVLQYDLTGKEPFIYRRHSRD